MLQKTRQKLVVLGLTIGLLGGTVSSAGAASAGANLVNPNQVYTYNIMQKDIRELAERYPGLISYESLGKSPYGRELWAVRIGRGEANLLLNGSHHAREWMTTSLLMEMLDTYSAAYLTGENFGPYHVRELLNRVSIWMVPMVNPDGVTLSQSGVAGLPADLAAALIRYNGNSRNFKRWKANMQGIDLNRQYPANWTGIRNSGKYPSHQNYKGTKPAQTPEVKLMMDLTYRTDPEMTVAYHSSGQIIFWHYKTPAANVARDKAYASDLARLTGYSLVAPEKNPSGGGYKDWFVQEFGRPGFTVEIGRYVGDGPLPLSAFKGVWAENKTVGLYAAQKSYDLWFRKQKLQPVGGSMTLFVQTPGYTKIGAAQSAGSLAPQDVWVNARKGDWYLVQTGAGERWIRPVPGSLGAVEAVNGTVRLSADSMLYKYPDLLAPKVSKIAPQELRVTGRSGTWLLVAYGAGSFWVDGRNSTPVLAPAGSEGTEPGGQPAGGAGGPNEATQGTTVQESPAQNDAAAPTGPSQASPGQTDSAQASGGQPQP